MKDVQFGLGTFGDVTHGPGGVPLPYADVIRNVVAQAVLADEVGVDAIILGEHHRDDFAISTPETILAGILPPLWIRAGELPGSLRGETQPSVRTLEGDPGDVVGHDQACAVEPRCFPQVSLRKHPDLGGSGRKS